MAQPCPGDRGPVIQIARMAGRTCSYPEPDALRRDNPAVHSECTVGPKDQAALVFSDVIARSGHRNRLCVVAPDDGHVNFVPYALARRRPVEGWTLFAGLDQWFRLPALKPFPVSGRLPV